MQEHPVPQNVTGYEFHLIGQMTLKQFMEIAAGVVLAILVNTTNLPEFVKIPIMIVIVALGALMAFVPYEGRPLDRWFFAFIKSIYQPTMFFWKKTNAVPPAFEYQHTTTSSVLTEGLTTEELRPIRTTRVNEYLQTIPGKNDAPLDEEDARANALLALFQDPQLLTTALSTTTPTETKTEPTQPAPVIIRPDIQGVIIPKNTPQPPPHIVSKEESQILKEPTKDVQVFGQLVEVQSGEKPNEAVVTQQAQTSKTLPFPSVPKNPNMIVGMVVTSDEKIIENAIVTIHRKADNTPVRALKTNALGQFGIITPLENGEYVITVEKDGLTFESTGIMLDGKVLQPALLKAKS